MLIYRFFEKDHALAAIAEERLRVSQIAFLNDPFELLSFKLTDKRMRRALNAVRTELNTTIGLISFSSDWRNPLMWAMYAKNHAGICIGFEVLEAHVLTVRYSSKRLSSEDLCSTEAGKRLSALRVGLLTKSDGWRHERERRIMVRLSNCEKRDAGHFWCYSDALRAAQVIIGANCVMTNCNSALLNERRLDFFTARAAFGKFEMCRNKQAIASSV